MADVLQAIMDRIVETAEPDRIVLFGSRGQGKSTAASDYDILVPYAPATMSKAS